MTPVTNDLRTWRDRLARTAGQVLAGELVEADGLSPARARAVVDMFADEGHNRPAIVPTFLAWRFNVDDASAPLADDRPDERAAQIDTGVWRWLAHTRTIGAAPPPPPPPPPGIDLRSTAGPLVGQGRLALEVWTEIELCVLHALWHARDRFPADASISTARLVAAARWFIEHVQPDNATNHPWAVHVFAWLGVTQRDTEAEMYAGTLLHNCQVTYGRPDALSAHILADAAWALRDPNP